MSYDRSGIVKLKPGTSFAALVELYTGEPSNHVGRRGTYKDDSFYFGVIDDGLYYMTYPTATEETLSKIWDWCDYIGRDHAEEAWRETIGDNSYMYRGPTRRSILALEIEDARVTLNSLTLELEEFDENLTGTA